MPSQPYWNELTSYVRTTLTSSFNKIDVVHLRIFLPDVLAAGNQCAWPNKSFACPSSDWIPSSSSNNRSSSNRVTITADRLSAPSTTSCARWCRNSRRPRARICQLPGYLWEDRQLVSVTTFIILLFLFLFSFLNDLTQFLQFAIFLFPFMDLTQFFLGMKSLRLPYHLLRGYRLN